MGDAILAVSILNSIKLSFPDSEVHYVLNDEISDLFENHPSIDRVVRFEKEERRSLFKYLRKIWMLMRTEYYDVIIDLRSTLNTLPFSIFSMSSKFRIGMKKGYTIGIFNHRVPKIKSNMDMVEYDLSFLAPLNVVATLKINSNFTLYVSAKEDCIYRAYLERHGLDLTKPILLCGVVAKLESKCWPKKYVKTVMKRILNEYPDLQIVFNYAPGREKEVAYEIYNEIGSPLQVFIDVEAKSMRELVCLSKSCCGYFGNEGGARHVVHAVGRPSMVVGSPSVNLRNWIPQNEVATFGISDSDICNWETLCKMSHAERYALLSPGVVWPILKQFLDLIYYKDVD